MHKRFLATLLWLFAIPVALHGQHQLESLFAPYDCRLHAELFYSEPVPPPAEPVAAVPEVMYVEDTVDGWKQWQLVENFAYGKNRGEMPMIIDLHALHPFFRDKIQTLMAECRKQGIELAIVETYRTHAKQNEYKGMGRGYTSSGAGKSRHQYGLAVDVVPIVDSAAVWDNTALWKKIGVTGEKLGLRWGGRWKKPYDPGHFEWTGGLTSVHLAKGQLPAIPQADEQYPCMDADIKLLRKYWRAWETAQASLTRR